MTGALGSLRSPMFRELNGWPRLRLIRSKSETPEQQLEGLNEAGNFMANRTGKRAEGKRGQGQPAKVKVANGDLIFGGRSAVGKFSAQQSQRQIIDLERLLDNPAAECAHFMAQYFTAAKDVLENPAEYDSATVESVQVTVARAWATFSPKSNSDSKMFLALEDLCRHVALKTTLDDNTASLVVAKLLALVRYANGWERRLDRVIPESAACISAIRTGRAKRNKLTVSKAFEALFVKLGHKVSYDSQKRVRARRNAKKPPKTS